MRHAKSKLCRPGHLQIQENPIESFLLQPADPALLDAAFLAAFFNDRVSRIPDESRFATLTEAPNKERIRYAKAGPRPRSPPGVSVSSTEKISKNFGKAVVEIVLP